MSITQGLLALNTSLYAVWKGEVGDDRLFYSAFNGTKWSNALTVPGNSSVGPSLALLNSKLYAAWKGEHIDSDQRLFFAAFDGTRWSAQAQIPNAGSSIGPALGVLGGHLYAVWKGEEGDDRLFWAAFNGSTWSGAAQIPGAASMIGPSLAAFGGKLWAAWRGSYGDQGLHYASFDGSTWSDFAQISNVYSSIGPSLAPFGSVLYAAWKGEGLDQGLYYASFNGSVWSGQAQIPNVGSSIGPAIAAFGGKLYAMWKGEGADQSLYYAAFDGTHWSSQATIPGNTGQDEVLPPEGGLMGNSNYMFYSDCNPIKNLAVTIDVTQDIVPASASGATKGFSFQLNCYSPVSARSTWQQYGFTVDTTNSPTAVISGWIDNWPNQLPNGSDLINYGVNLISLPNPKLPAGYKVTISLGSDDKNNINSVTFVVVDNHGVRQSSQTIALLSLQLDSSLGKPPTDPQYLPGPVTQQDLAPINACELNLVGPTNGERAVLTSGAGTITYTAADILTAVNSQPACTSAQGIFTAENANTAYSALPASPSLTLTQSFSVDTSVMKPMTRRVGTPRASSRRT